MNRIMMLGATVATTGITAAQVDPQLVDGLGKWPATIVLGAIARLCVWLMYKQGRDFAQAQERTATAVRDSTSSTSKAILDLVAELKQRPCVRDPHND